MENISAEEMLRRIQELQFAAVELNLYLDNFPTNKQALSDYNKITEDLNRMKKLYESTRGPITNFGTSPSQYPWRWIEEPWPWEVME